VIARTLGGEEAPVEVELNPTRRFTAESLFRLIAGSAPTLLRRSRRDRQKIASVIGPCVFREPWIDPVIRPAATLVATLVVMRPGMPDATRPAALASLRRHRRG
jgi:hypothetical protein